MLKGQLKKVLEREGNATCDFESKQDRVKSRLSNSWPLVIVFSKSSLAFYQSYLAGPFYSVPPIACRL